MPLLPEIAPLRIGLSLALFAAAGLILVLSLAAFRQHRTTVNPYGTPSSLVATGPYRFSRNPMYVGLLLMTFAFAPALNSAWIAAATVLLLVLLDLGVVRPEERFLRDRFTAPYAAFTKRVRRWL